MSEKWINSTNMEFKNLRLGPRGDLGQVFVEELCESLGFNVVPNETYTGEYDTTIGGHRFEVKTATLGVSNGFQFNNVRTKYEVNFLFCLGIAPNDILFNVYRETDVASMKEGPYILDGCQDSVLPGHMTGMAKKADVEDNFKLWKTGRELRRIEELQAVLTALFNE